MGLSSYSQTIFKYIDWGSYLLTISSISFMCPNNSCAYLGLSNSKTLTNVSMFFDAFLVCKRLGGQCYGTWIAMWSERGES